MKRNLLTKIALLILLINILTACDALQTTPSPKPPLRIEFTQWWGDYTLLIAQEKGYFEKNGVQVEPVYYEVFSETYPDLASGQIDGALIAIGDTININRSTPMKVVAVQDNGGENVVIVGPEINSIEDLRGKTIGMVMGSQFELTVVKMLQSANMSISDVTIVAIDPENALAALEKDQVQAAFTWEPYLSDAISKGYKIIYPQGQEQFLFPDLIVFRKSIVDDRPEDVRAFLKAWFQAVEYRLQHEGETRDIAARYLGIGAEEVKPDDHLRIYTPEDNKTLFNIQEANSIYSITKITSDYLISIGAMAEEIDPLELLDPSYLP
ncbi:MAG: ABC transporter substrate-binding protein [Anaerolineales bacterium]|nr:ABC transporter substrate-binding protein [Anaerolineales bacterium]